MKDIKSAGIAAFALVFCFAYFPFAKSESYSFAAGTGLTWQVREDYGTTKRNNFIPEIVAQGYFALSEPEILFIRPALRLGYSGLYQQEMPKQIRIEETDTLVSAECAVLYDGYIIPTLGIGSGLDFRRIKSKPGNRIISESGPSLNRSETLSFSYISLGIGLPLFQGLTVIEPNVRYEYLEYDKRSNLRIGFDVTLSF